MAARNSSPNWSQPHGPGEEFHGSAQQEEPIGEELTSWRFAVYLLDDLAVQILSASSDSKRHRP